MGTPTFFVANCGVFTNGQGASAHGLSGVGAVVVILEARCRKIARAMAWRATKRAVLMPGITARPGETFYREVTLRTYVGVWCVCAEVWCRRGLIDPPADAAYRSARAPIKVTAMVSRLMRYLEKDQNNAPESVVAPFMHGFPGPGAGAIPTTNPAVPLHTLGGRSPKAASVHSCM